MRRTLERRHFPVSGVERGEVVAATTFMHPTRGAVNCPAAPVAHAGARISGLPVRYGSVGGAAGDAVLHAVSYVDPGGQAVGLGVAVHRDDERASRLAEDVVREWAEVMRTRRVLLDDTGPSCAGLRREAALVAKVTGLVYVLAARRRWPWRDARLVERLADVPDGATVVLPAHGVDPRTAAEARSRDIWIVDATCPLVARATPRAWRSSCHPGFPSRHIPENRSTELGRSWSVRVVRNSRNVSPNQNFDPNRVAVDGIMGHPVNFHDK